MNARCDFCHSGSPIQACYAAAPAALTFSGPYGTRTLRLDGTWIACPPCRRLLDAGDRAALLRRAYRRFGVRGGVARGALAAVHGAFWAAREDEAAAGSGRCRHHRLFEPGSVARRGVPCPPPSPRYTRQYTAAEVRNLLSEPGFTEGLTEKYARERKGSIHDHGNTHLL